jgi:hypothetical protein
MADQEITFGANLKKKLKDMLDGTWAEQVFVAMTGLYPKECAAGGATVLEITNGAGAVGDYIDSITIKPQALTGIGTVVVQDGAGASFTIWEADAVASKYPVNLPLGWTSKVGAWKVTCGANVKALASGGFR